MGREISHVMEHQGADGLARTERQREERINLPIARLPVREDPVVAVIGAFLPQQHFLVFEKP